MVEPNGLITLLTDFGVQDVYVGVMKGVMLQINPALTFVDLTHEVPAQNIALGSFQLQNAYTHFAPGTVHLTVVDPGVGGPRDPIILALPTGYFVGPNNGIFSGILADSLSESGILDGHAVTLDNPNYWYTSTPSHTFQGRDIFAAAAAHLATGVALMALGTHLAFEDLVRLRLPQHQRLETGIRGSVQSIDRFGNMVTTIPAHLAQGRPWRVEVAGAVFPAHLTYSNTALGSPLSLVGSHGWIELAVNGGNAQQYCGLTLGDPIELTWV